MNDDASNTRMLLMMRRTVKSNMVCLVHPVVGPGCGAGKDCDVVS
jgi:hypothetical protein